MASTKNAPVGNGDGRSIRNLCTCGLVVAVSGQHQFSIYHHHATRIRTLLLEPCISYAEIGRRLNITRERVRQIAVKLIVTMGDQIKSAHKRTVCATNKAKPCHALREAVIRECERRGLTWKLVKCDRARRFRARSLIIEGRLCYLFRLYPRPHQQNHVLVNAVGDHAEGAEFILYCSETLRPWLVIPIERAPINKTTISINPHPLGRRRKRLARHDWHLFFDAWDLLGNKSASD